VDDQLELKRYIALLHRWAWLIALCAILGAASAFVVSSRKTPVYRTSTTLMIQQSPESGTSEYNALRTGELLARTYAEILVEKPVLEEVIARLDLEASPGNLAKRVSVNRVPDTQLIRLAVEDTDPVRAALTANTIAETFIAYNAALQEDRYADSLNSIQAQMDELSTRMEETQAAIETLGVPETAQEQAELSRLDTTLAQYRNTYASLVQSYEEMRLTAAQSMDNVTVVRAADVPESPVGPQTMRNTALAGVTGAMVAVGVAFLIEYLDDTIKTPEDARRATGLETLGAIGRVEDETYEVVAAEEPLSPIAEAYRVLRTNIGFSGVDQPLRTILVTSPQPTEGKSFTVANLAVVMAQAGLRVVVVDADLRRARMHKLFDLHTQNGLSGALLEGSLDGNVQRVSVEGMEVLPAGKLPPNPSEMVGSERMLDFLESLSDEADVVLVDSPPVLPVADAVIMAQRVDGVLLVVEVGETRSGEAQEAVDRLKQVGANTIGVVLNRVPVGGGYYYNYYYQYAYYGEENGNGSRRRSKGPLAALRKWMR
jgi:non-specific protein-tyrosine kinase